jgi:hypothetical protein
MHLPEVQPFEDTQGARDGRPSRPIAMALRNAGAALLGIGLMGGAYWLRFYGRGYRGPVYWWILGAAALYAVLICFAHALFAMRFGARRAGNALKGVVIATLVAMLVGLWWYLQPKDNEW